MSIIEAVGLVKRYGGLVAVDNVGLTVEQGEFFGILGPNGAGKTTLLEMIEGIREPTAGTAWILGEPTWPRNAAVLPKIGVQLQASAFFDRLRTREQLSIFADLYGMRHSRCDEVLAMVGLSDKARTYAEDLSGGQRQRLSIAFALINGPQVLFLDEPTASLDPQGRRDLWDVVTGINASGTTVVLTTHHIEEAEALCDRVAIMNEGHILTTDTPTALISELGAPTRIAVTAKAQSAAQLAGIPDVESIDRIDDAVVLTTHDPASVLVSLSHRGALEGLRIEPARLEDVFLSLTRTGVRP